MIYIVQDLRHALDVATTIPQLIIVHPVIDSMISLYNAVSIHCMMFLLQQMHIEKGWRAGCMKLVYNHEVNPRNYPRVRHSVSLNSGGIFASSFCL